MRFYEARMYAGKLATAGTAVTGMPLISLGHNEYISVAMTTGGIVAHQSALKGGERMKIPQYARLQDS